MSELTDLYQQVILDHNRRPRNYGKLEGANRQAEGFNPICGDHLTLYLRLKGDVIDDLRFEGEGCAISKASASLMTDSLKGKTAAEAETLFERIHEMLTGSGEVDLEAQADELGKLAVFSGVREYPSRVKCASLSWHALHSALQGEATPVSTE
ncbi:MAG TPA: SUF system NifU family Fe-S cluster assembly protein [Chloroflexota bacterium]|jgi:nitrogen fixation NifU-like protein